MMIRLLQTKQDEGVKRGDELSACSFLSDNDNLTADGLAAFNPVYPPFTDY